MSQFERLEAQVIQAQQAVDMLGLSEWADALKIGITTRGLITVNPRPRTDRREIVAMPEQWLKDLAAWREASAAGLDYLARYARRHQFVSIHAASRWLDIERAARVLHGRVEGPVQARTPRGEEPATQGLNQLLTRADTQRAGALQTLAGCVFQAMRRGNFEVTEALDAIRRAERIRK
jgi:hypothetical protein